MAKVTEGLAKLCEVRRELFKKFGGYPANSTHVVVAYVKRRWVPFILFGEGARPDHFHDLFDPAWITVPPAEPLYGGKAALGTCVEGHYGDQGSLGWNVMYDGEDALITSRHVVIHDFTSTTTPRLASVASSPAGSAKVVWSPIMEPATRATFDIAICKYKNGEGERRSNCGGLDGYPSAMAMDLDPEADTFGFAGVQLCGDATLVAVADVLTEYELYNGGLIWLQNQLLFDADVTHGHSGALIKRRCDNAAAALICARTAHHGFAVANPLFLIDWDVKSLKQDELPEVTLRRPVPRDVEVWKVPQPELPCADSEPRQLTPEERRLDAIARFEWMQAKP